mgnify:CR=1 FL=1
MPGKIYNISKLYGDLKAANIPMHGFSNTQTAEICYVDNATHEQKDQAEAIKLSHIPYDYREMRVREYPSIGDQLDCIYKQGADESAWREQIATIKTKWAKNYNDLTSENKAIADAYFERKFNGGY